MCQVRPGTRVSALRPHLDLWVPTLGPAHPPLYLATWKVRSTYELNECMNG